MRDILVAYPSKDTALKLRSLLECEGFNVTYVCATGASVFVFLSKYIFAPFDCGSKPVAATISFITGKATT